jgi:hypothetical protein
VLRRGRVLAIAILVVLAGCEDDPIRPGIHLSIENLPDSFIYRASGIYRYTKVSNYTWQNTGSQAVVTMSGALSEGEAWVELLDAEEVQVFEGSLGVEGEFTSLEGVPGAWNVRVSYFEATALADFRVEKAP